MRVKFALPLWGALALTVGGCGARPVDLARQPIIGGSTVPDDELPTLVRIAMDLDDTMWSVCTGTLISPTAILTAAHCTDAAYIASKFGKPAPKEPIFHYTFMHAVAHKKDTQLAKSVEFHQPWHVDYPYPGHSNDIGIVHLSQPVTGRRYQKLATSADIAKLHSGDPLLAAGYGLSVGSDNGSIGTLRKGIDNFGQAGSYEVTTSGNGPQHICEGDSGGPLFASTSDDLQIGITSRVEVAPPSCTGRSAYTRVDQYLDWIRERVPDLDGTPPSSDGGAPADGGLDDGGSMPGSDGGMIPDSGAPQGGPDGAAPDAGSKMDDGGSPPPPSPPSSGCTLGGGAVSAAWPLILLWLLASAVRRRRPV